MLLHPDTLAAMIRAMSYRYRPGIGIVEYVIITCVVLWIATSISARLEDVLAFVPADFAHQPWSIVTSIFVHARFPDFTHILFNMITLYFFGNFLVNIVGDRMFLLIFVVGGIVGNLLYWVFAANHLAGTSPFTGVIGASGAIFAAGGALAVLRPRSSVYVFPIPAPIPLWIAVLGGFLLTFAATGVAWQAHVGGLVAGLIMGLIFRQRSRGRWL